MDLRRLYDVGWFYLASLGIQVDIAVAWLRVKEGWVEGSFCDHDCTSKHGGYDCPAAKSANVGIRPDTMPGVDDIVPWLQRGQAGQRKFRDGFLAARLEPHLRRFRVPEEIWPLYRQALSSDRHEVNIFGGNPELSPALFPLLQWLREQGHIINLTTTGGQAMRSEDFRNKLKANPPDRLAMSADDLTEKEASERTVIPLDSLRQIHRDTPHYMGQDRKVVEALYVGRLAALKDAGLPPILFNMVVSRRNVRHAIAMIESIEAAMPDVLVNPYPAQSSFMHGEPEFQEDDLPYLERLVDYAIYRTMHDARFVKRLHYWLMLKAAFLTWKDHPRTLLLAMSGYYMWRCYQPDAAWYLQIGRFEIPGRVPTMRLNKDERRPPSHAPGGHLGCFWNATTISKREQVPHSSEVAEFLETDIQREASLSPNPCPGCIMPRLLFHAVSLEAGMDAALIPAYVRLRREHLGF
jgi:hypothetical protein